MPKMHYGGTMNLEEMEPHEKMTRCTGDPETVINRKELLALRSLLA